MNQQQAQSIPTLHLHAHLGLMGFFPKIEAFKGKYVYDQEGEHICGENGRYLVHEVPGSRRLLPQSSEQNKLLTAGMNVMNTQAGWMNNCQVGSDNSPPLASQTALGTWVAGTSTIHASSTGANATIPYYGWALTTYRFAEGVAAGNLNEVAIGWDTSGATIICRHRTVNVVNEEVTIVVQSDDWLDVTYQLRYYPPLDDVAGTITFDGDTFDTITRASEVTSKAAWGDNIGAQIGQYSPSVSSWSAFDGDLGTLEQAPNGTSQACDNLNQFNEVYQNNSFEIVVASATGPTGWNMTGGFRCIRFMTTAGYYQCRFGMQGGGDEKVQKTIDFTMAIKWTLSWGELIAILAVPEPVVITGIDATLTYNP